MSVIDVAWAALDPMHEAYDVKVVRIVNQITKRVQFHYEDYVEFEDLRQEAVLMLANQLDLIDAVKRSAYDQLKARLERDLINHCELAFTKPWNSSDDDGLDVVKRPLHTAAIRDGRKSVNDAGETVYLPKHDSLDGILEAYDQGEGSGLFELSHTPSTASGVYTSESVERLLPAVWDESYCYGLPIRDDAPDSDMPRGSVNKATSNNLAAYIVDIKDGWRKTPLTIKERRALLLSFGLGWTQEEVAFNQEVASHSTISRRIESGLSKIANTLNGTTSEQETLD